MKKSIRFLFILVSLIPCISCVLELPNSVLFDYEVSMEQVEIQSYLGNEINVVIPDSIDGVPVKKIGPRVFSGCKFLESVVLPNTLESIDDEAFAGCTSIDNLKIPENIKNIHNDAFKNWTSSQRIVFTNIKTDSGVWNNLNTSAMIEVPYSDKGNFVVVRNNDSSGFKIVFYTGTDSRIDFYYDDKITAIGNDVFADYKDLEFINLPSDLNSIGAGAFRNCTGLQRITIPSSVKYVGDGAFENWTAVQTIKIEGNTDSWSNSWNSNCKAYIEKDKYKITFDGIDKEPIYVNSGSKFTIPEYQKDDCIITDISDADGKSYMVGDTFYVDRDLCLTWKWAKYSCTEDVQYIFCDDGVVISAYSGENTVFDIPEIIDGHVVVGVNREAFKGNTSLKCVNIHKNIVEVGSYAFTGFDNTQFVNIDSDVNMSEWDADWNTNCSARINYNNSDFALTYKQGKFVIDKYIGVESDELDIPETINNIPVVSIGSNSFARSHIRKVNFSSNIRTVDSYAFYESDIESAFLNEELKRIAEYAFAYCSNLNSINIPRSLEFIGSKAFSHDGNIMKIVIPNTLWFIDSYVFDEWKDTQLVLLEEEIDKSRWSKRWNSNDYGVNKVCIIEGYDVEEDKAYTLTDEGYKITYWNPELVDFIVPSMHNGIPVYSIRYSYVESALENIVLSDSIVEIDSHGLLMCSSLSKIELSTNIRNVGLEAFCSNTKVFVEYGAPVSQWDSKWLPQYDYFVDGCDYLFRVSNNEVFLRGYTGSDLDIVLPDVIEGMDVVGIEYPAFRTKTQIRSITIPSNIHSVDSSAFLYWTPEQTIIIECDTDISTWDRYWSNGSTCFIEFKGKPVDLEFELEYIDGAFYITGYTGNDVNVLIPDIKLHGLSVTMIKSNAFNGKTWIQKIGLQKFIKYVDFNAFNGWTSEQQIYIDPEANVDNWHSSWDYGCNAKVIKGFLDFPFYVESCR